MIVENVVYVAGRRVARPESLAETYKVLRGKDRGLAWIDLYQPSKEEFSSLATEFALHELAVEDAIVAHERPKIERYGATLFVVLRAARYHDATEEVTFSEVHVFVGPDFVLTVRHGNTPDLRAVRARMERHPELLGGGPEAVLYGILDRVVDDYGPVADGLENDVDEIEAEVFGGKPRVSRRIYELSQQVVEFQRATRPLAAVLAGLTAGFDKYRIGVELQRYLRDVQDHLVRVIERLDGFRQMLADALTVDATLVAQQQNEEMRRLTEASLAQNEEVKKVSAWAAILFAPTVIGTIYGMNFDSIPETEWVAGYPFALGLMGVSCAMLFLTFRRRGWL